MIQYGNIKFKTICHCGKECKMPKDLDVGDYMNGINETGISSVFGNCPDHGRTELKAIPSVPLPDEIMIPV